MTKQELLETYTAEQLAEMVERSEKYSEIKETAKKQVGERLKLIDFSKNPYSAICDLKDLIYEFAKGCDDEDMNNLEYYKRRISELEEECVKKQNEINQLEESYGRMKARVDTYVNYILPRATEEARKMIDNHQYAGIRIATCEEWSNRGKDNQSEVEKYRKAFEDAKNERDCQIAELKEYTDSLKCSVDRKQDAINQIDSIICELFGVAHYGDIYSEDFKELLKEKSAVGKTVCDFLPTEPIKVAEILINASKKRTNCMTGKEYDKYIFEKWQLRQIAEHLLVYCNHNGEEEK